MTMLISRDDMAELIEAGRAHPWTHAVGPSQRVYVAARMGEIWWAVLEGTNGYQALSAEQSAALTEADASLAISAAMIAAAEAKTAETGRAGHGGEAEDPVSAP